MAKKIGIYVHLPFCRSKCAYCDFYSEKNSEETEKLMDLYQKALLTHFKSSSMQARGFSVDTIYFGGGTPTFYGALRIDGLLRGLRKCFRVERDAEITVEGNPDSVVLKEIQQLRRCGVNRISLGMQSAQQEELTAVGRPHTPEETRQAVGVLKSASMRNISLDLIYGLPKQTFSSWQETLEEAIALEPQHLSCYGLKVEEGTPLYERVARGELLPEEEEQADLYLWTVERLKEVGYHHYEISNFAQEGQESKHNLGYWLGKPYLSFGASAASDFGGYRYTFLEDAQAYCACVLEGGGELFVSHELMSEKERQQEYVFLRLRTSQGLCGREYEKALGLEFTPLSILFQRYEEEGWAERVESDLWRLTAQGYLRSNLIMGSLLEVQESSEAPQPQSITVKISGDSDMKMPEEMEGNLKNVNQKRKKKETVTAVLQEGEDGQFYFL